MTTHWRQSITSRTLLQSAAAVGFIILLATAITYGLVFRATEERSLIHLNEYLSERTQREEQNFAAVALNLQTAREAFLKRFRESDPPGFFEQWDHYFEKCADGGWRSKKQFSNDYEYAPLWGHKDIGPSPDVKRRILVMFEVCQKFLPGWVHNFRSLYGFTSDEMVLVGFDPGLPGWIYYQPADYDQNGLEFGQLAMPAFNPTRKMAWTGTTTNDGSGESLVSVILPVDLDGRHLITIGHDLKVNNLVAETVRGDVKGLSHMIFRQDGRLIAHSQFKDAIFKGNGQFNMKSSGDATLMALYAAVANHQGRQLSGYDSASGNYFAVHRMAGPEWFYLTTMPRSVLREQAFHVTRWVLWSALASLACELALLGFILRRSIARPIGELVNATRRVTAGEPGVVLELNRHDELGALSGAFNEMAAKVRERDEALREEKAALEDRVAARTAQLRASNQSLSQSEESLARALARQTELVELKTSFVSLVSHEFRTPLEVITSSAFNLERYHERLEPAKRHELLEAIQRAVRRMAGMMEQVLLLGRMDPGRATFQPVQLDLSAFCRQLCAEIESVTARRCPIELELKVPAGGALGDEAVLRHLLVNLLSNAIKYSPPGSPVRFSVVKAGADAILTISDQGCGIPEADQANLYEAFRRAANVGHTPGTGLGLVIVRRCIDLHGGRITCHSREGEGTTFTVHLPLFGPDL